MRQIADFHIHSRYSRACSRDLVLEKIDAACRLKGVDVIGTGDFTHPAWFSAIKKELEEINGSGLYKLRAAADEKIKFVLTVELALIYKSSGRCRRIHLVVHAPNLEAAEKLRNALDKKYNIKSDGRPILGLNAEDLCRLCFSIDPDFFIYPAHIWTPWFSVFGSKSGFSRMEECFGEFTPRIRAYETGLSSDPEMNWRVSALDSFALLSNSDAHSLVNIAREANVFDLSETSFKSIHEALKSRRAPEYTIEFYPEEGMYHFDGHRDCGASFSPAETRKRKGECPVCGKEMTIGVMSRVEELSDRPLVFRPPAAPGFKKLVELDKIIAESLGVKNRRAKKVEAVYKKMISSLGSELSILIDRPLKEIKEASSPIIAEAVRRVRAGELTIKPGFDGQYGEIRIFNEKERKRQQELF